MEKLKADFIDSIVTFWNKERVEQLSYYSPANPSKSYNQELWLDDDEYYVVEYSLEDVWVHILHFTIDYGYFNIIGREILDARDVSQLFQDDWLEVDGEDMIRRLRKYFCI